MRISNYFSIHTLYSDASENKAFYLQDGLCTEKLPQLCSLQEVHIQFYHAKMLVQQGSELSFLSVFFSGRYRLAGFEGNKLDVS